MQGIKRKRRCQNQCEQHIFALKNLKNNSKYDIRLSFCPKYQRQPYPPEHTFAEYNNDGLFYTSAFALGLDKKIIAKNLQKEMLDHQKLIKQNCQKYNQIVFPRPNSKHTTCSVCKQTYKNYYQHIFSDQHGEKIQLSPYNVFVKELCQLFIDQWEGCAEKADQDAFEQDEIQRNGEGKKGSEELNLDDILEEEDIESNPSRISKYLEDDGEEESEVKEVVMRRPVRVYEPAYVSKPQRQFQDRESRKKSINFAAFFEDEPKKKVINDHRQAINAPPRKYNKTSSLAETKSKQKITDKKQPHPSDTDPFIIEYNARGKRKEKKSYYYLKKKQREEREQRQREMLKKQENEQALTKSKPKLKQEQQQIQSENQDEIQNEISKSSEQEYEKYLDQFHQKADKTQEKVPEIKKTISKDFNLFEEVQKKPLTVSLFESFASSPKNQQKIPPQKIMPISRQIRYLPAQQPLLSSDVYALKKPFEKEAQPLFTNKKLGCQNNEQKQQILENRNKIISSVQNELPLFHKFKNPLEKQIPKQIEIRQQKASHEVFNEYQQKIRQYHKQKDYNAKFKQNQKINTFQEKLQQEISHDPEETVGKGIKSYLSKDFEETYKYGAERGLTEQTSKVAEIKTENYNAAKYNSISQTYYKKLGTEKDLQNSMPLGPLMPQNPYGNPHQFYPPYNYPISPYGYPIHDTPKTQRPSLKFEEQRQNEPFQRGYYYGGWQAPYFVPTPPTGIIPPQATQLESLQKGFSNQQFDNGKNEAKSAIYPGYPSGYPGYPPLGYPGYYHSPGAAYPTTQRPEYPHPSPNLRVPTQNPPNTSININFPMYVGSPYHNPYQYQPNPQRYPGQQSQNPASSSFLPPSQSKPVGNSYSGYGPGNQSNLPPYAEYQEYKKREGDRRR